MCRRGLTEFRAKRVCTLLLVQPGVNAIAMFNQSPIECCPAALKPAHVAALLLLPEFDRIPAAFPLCDEHGF